MTLKDRIRYKEILNLVFILFMTVSCKEECQPGFMQPQKTLSFTKIKPITSNIWFENEIQETYDFNYYTFPYMYGGAGVAVGDVNNDGLPDIYFAGNMVRNRLYINQGDFKFADITTQSGVGADEEQRWVTGVSMADVNNDGRLEFMYVHQDL